ncbi:MAG: PD-(D/E)XK nuclease family protein [Clostridiales bacterium]|nr:PD-(D/E)XK nuclease family protein [Candidatus Equinaster intestinalis]
MLQLILGRAGTGKSYTVFEKVKTDVEKGKEVVILVPEQFTFECERTLLHTLGDKASTNAQVISFTRLYDEVARRVGGRVADIISESNRTVLMGQALKESRERLKIWGRYASSARFAQTLLSTVTEFKTSCVTSEQLAEVADNVKSDYLRCKLHDVAVVYSAYNALLGGRFLDPQDNLDRLASSLLDYKFFENKTVYVDSFKNFTGQQYRIIDRIISQAADVTFAFTTPDLIYDKFDIFKCVRDTIKHITGIAEKNGKRFEKPQYLTEFHFKNESLKSIESAFSDNHLTELTPLNDVAVCECETPYDEAEFAARTIRKLVRKEGYRYRDFVIIARDAEKYRRAVETACRKNGVFCFSDRKRSVVDMPLTVLISAYLKLASSYKTEYIFEVFHSGLTHLTEEEICEIENYVYIWDIDGNDWLKTWDMNPKGFETVDEDKLSEYNEALAKLNSCRQKTVDSIEAFRRRFKGTPQNMVLAVVELIEKLEIGSKLKEFYFENKQKDSVSDDAKQGYDAIMEALDGIVKCLPEKEITIKEFIDNWEVSVEAITVGNIPQMLDEVTFGSADRIRPSRPKIAFILGAYQDEFPKTAPRVGIFASHEREALKKGGIDIFDTDISVAVEEDYLVYTSLCCASEKLFVSYPAFAGKDSGVLPSEIVNTLKNSFGDSLKVLKEPADKLDFENTPETEKAAVSYMCSSYNVNKSASVTAETALKNTAGISIDGYLKSADKQNTFISEASSEKLFGKKLSVSATMFESYYQCRFKFFCKYGLRAKKLQKAELNGMQRGTVVHFVMEKLITEYGKKIGELGKDEIDSLVDRYIAEYIAQIGGVEEFFDERMKYLISKVSTLVKDVALQVAAEFAQSDFSPDYCELKIGNSGAVKSKRLICENGTEMTVNGSIDRVDIWNGYVRIVDYKTGKKNFRLSDVLVGLNMQMLLYLYSLIRGQNEDFNKLAAAGILYLPSRRPKKDNDLTMNGIIVDEEKVYTAMEKENAGQFIPKYTLDKNGQPSSSSYVAPSVFETVFDYIEKLLAKMARGIETGDMKVLPTDNETEACQYCDYYSVCCYENGEHAVAQKLSNADALLKIKEEL